MLDDLTDDLQLIDANSGRYADLNRYAAGEQGSTFIAPEIRAALDNRLNRVSVNIPGLLVSSLVERLRVTGFTRGGKPDPRLWGDWRRNDLDQLAPVVHREAFVLGDSFVICWARPDGSPLITVESAEQMAAVTDPATRETLRAIKRWETPQGTHAMHYFPDRIVHLKSDNPGATTTGFRVVETIANPLGQVPVVRFRNGGRLLSGGVSEMADILPLTDAATKLATDMLVASEYGARPRRWATGLELAEDAEGNAVNPVGENDRMMINEAPEGKFGQLPAGDLAAYEKAIGVVMRLISAVSGLPEHMLGIGGDNPTSADSIRASEAALTARAEAKQLQLGRSWEQVARLAVAIRDGSDPAAVEVQVSWADPSTRSVAQEADAVTKLFAAGLLPASVALKRLGYADDEIELIRTARRAEALDAAGTDLSALLA